MKTVLQVVAVSIVVAIVIFALMWFGDDSVERCRERGEAYMRDIGSWPLLTNGQDARDNVRLRCERKPDTAF